VGYTNLHWIAASAAGNTLVSKPMERLRTADHQHQFRRLGKQRALATNGLGTITYDVSATTNNGLYGFSGWTTTAWRTRTPTRLWEPQERNE